MYSIKQRVIIMCIAVFVNFLLLVPVYISAIINTNVMDFTDTVSSEEFEAISKRVKRLDKQYYLKFVVVFGAKRQIMVVEPFLMPNPRSRTFDVRIYDKYDSDVKFFTPTNGIRLIYEDGKLDLKAADNAENIISSDNQSILHSLVEKTLDEKGFLNAFFDAAEEGLFKVQPKKTLGDIIFLLIFFSPALIIVLIHMIRIWQEKTRKFPDDYGNILWKQIGRN